MTRHHPILAAARQFLRERWRDGRLPVIALLLLVLSGFATLLSSIDIARYEHHRVAAEKEERETWMNQGARNPHTVAHFSHLAFKPAQPGQVLDKGPSDFLGSIVWMEAHWQRPANFRAADDRLDLGRLADLQLAWIWQVFGPLALIILGFDAIAQERERGTLALLAGNGIDLRALVIGKVLGLFGISALVLCAAMLPAAVSSYWLFPTADSDTAWRLLAWLGLHLVYLLLVATVVIAVSARNLDSRSALSALLLVWIIEILLVPRIAVTGANTIQPVPSATQFWLDIEHDTEFGLSANESAAARSQQLERETLAHYQVQSLDQLPVSFAALSLQSEENYGHAIFDRRFSALQQAYRQQEQVRLAIGLLSPLVAVQVVSAGSAATDLAHHLQFTAQVEVQRRALIAALNADMIAHGAGQDFSYLADSRLWRRLPQAEYRSPSFASLSRQYLPAIAATLLWLVAALAYLQRVIAFLRANPRSRADDRTTPATGHAA